MPYRGLWHACIHMIRRHLTSTVSAPAECALLEIAGAEHEATYLVHNIHEDLRPPRELVGF